MVIGERGRNRTMKVMFVMRDMHVMRLKGRIGLLE